MKFEDLPITSDVIERKPGGWHRWVKKEITIKDLIEDAVLALDDPEDQSELTQILRHLRNAMTEEL